MWQSDLIVYTCTLSGMQVNDLEIGFIDFQALLTH